jgi:hypothetical protein
MVLLNDPEWSQWSNAEIARRAGVGNWLASNLRAEILSVRGAQIERTYTTKHGTAAVMVQHGAHRDTHPWEVWIVVKVSQPSG